MGLRCLRVRSLENSGKYGCSRRIYCLRCYFIYSKLTDKSYMNLFWWKCDICKFGNPPKLKSCANCGYPIVPLKSSEAVDKQMKDSASNYAHLTFIQKIFVFLGFLCSGFGVFLASFAPSLSLNGVGIVLALLGDAILTNFRKTAIKVQTKPTNKQDD